MYTTVCCTTGIQCTEQYGTMPLVKDGHDIILCTMQKWLQSEFFFMSQCYGKATQAALCIFLKQSGPVHTNVTLHHS